MDFYYPPRRMVAAVIAVSLTALAVTGCVRQPDPTIVRDTDPPPFSGAHALTQQGPEVPAAPKRFTPDVLLEEAGQPFEPVEPNLPQLLERIRASEPSSERQALVFTYVQHAGELPPEERTKAFAALEALFQ